MASRGKRIFAFMIMMAMMLSVFSGCKKGEQAPAGTVSDFESQTHIQVSASTAESSSGETTVDTSKVPLSGEFVVSEKKYDYKDGNIELLYIENQTNRHYDVTIHGAYLDENGETIQEETQTFAGFASGWSNHFMFYPRMAFDSFTYTVETVESTEDSRAVNEYGDQLKVFDQDGNPLVSYIELSYEKNLIWDRGLEPINQEHPDNAKEVRFLELYGKMTNTHPSTTIACEFFVMILDSDGEVYVASQDFWDYVGTLGGCNNLDTKPAGAVGDENYYERLPLKEQEIGEDETIPDTVQGVFTAIFAVKRVWDRDDWDSRIS